MWVPGRTGIEGIVIAEQLANEGSEAAFFGPESFSVIMVLNTKQGVVNG
jgi:hypothetical protein